MSRKEFYFAYLIVAMVCGVVTVSIDNIIINRQGRRMLILEQSSGQRPKAAVAFAVTGVFKLAAIQLQFE